MKKILYYSFMIFAIYSCKENVVKTSINHAKINIDSLENTGFKAYSNNPLEAVEIFKKVANEYRKIDNFKKAGQTNLNIAGIYEEKLSNYSAALLYSKESLNDWKIYKDSNQMANLFKYVGYLEGLNNNFEKAEQDIQTAVEIYTKLNFNQGIAVSNINMAKVRLMENKYEDAKAYYEKSKKFWLKEANNSRIFDNNLVGIEIFKNLNQSDQLIKLIQENTSILNNQDINIFLEDKFIEIKKEIQ